MKIQTYTGFPLYFGTEIQLNLVNSRTFKDLWNEIQGLQAPVLFSRLLINMKIQTYTRFPLYFGKFKDFSRTFKDPEVAFSRTNSRQKFTAWTVLQHI